MDAKVANAIKTHQTYTLFCEAYHNRTQAAASQYGWDSQEWKIVEADAMADMARARKAMMDAQEALTV